MGDGKETALVYRSAHALDPRTASSVAAIVPAGTRMWTRQASGDEDTEEKVNSYVGDAPEKEQIDKGLEKVMDTIGSGIDELGQQIQTTGSNLSACEAGNRILHEMIGDVADKVLALDQFADASFQNWERNKR